MIDIIDNDDIEKHFIIDVDIEKLNALIEMKLKSGDYLADFDIKIKNKIKSNNTNGIFTKFQKDKKITKWDKFLCSVGWHRYIKYHIKGKHNMIYSKERCRKCGREPLTLI